MDRDGDELIVHRGIRTSAVFAARRSTRAFAACLATAVFLRAARVAVAQDLLSDARDLYRAAAYEDALVRLNSLRGSAHVADESRFIEEYRAFCLLALGRTTEAERAIEAVVTAAPSLHSSDVDDSPRVRAAFREVRQRLLPAIIQQQYAEAKAAFDRHDLAAARAGFRQVLDLLADEDMAFAVRKAPLSELHTLASEFLDLSTKAAPPPRPAPAIPLPPSAAARQPATQPSAPRIYGIEDSNVVPPTVLRQSWAALADVFAVRPGTIAIVIDERGAVESATMTVTVNPVYDRLALATAKGWRYRPATLDGIPVKFRKVIQLDLKATR